MSKLFTVLAIVGLLSTVGFSQTTTTSTTCDPTTCKPTATGTTKQQCCDSTGKCATDSGKCVTCGGVGIYCAGQKNPSGTCDASKCQYGCCKSDGTCGAQSDCTGAGPCASGNVTGGQTCSTCCNSNKICVFANQTSTCKYCTNDLLVCSGVSENGDLQQGTCTSSVGCQYGCCNGKTCGTSSQCAAQTCNVNTCNTTNGVSCCLKNGACAASASECYQCGAGLLCPGIDTGSACVATNCQYGCCDGTKCGTSSVCSSQNKTWLWWLIGGIVAGLLLLTLVICYIRARRRRLLAAQQGYGVPSASGQYAYAQQR